LGHAATRIPPSSGSPPKARTGALHVLLLGIAGATPCLAMNTLYAADMPKRKSGLWETTITSSRGNAPHTIQRCIDRTTDDIASPQGPRPSPKEKEMQCEKRDFHKDGDKMVIDTVCKHSGTTVTTHAIVTGSFDSSFRMESTSTYDPPMNGLKDSHTTVESKWLGPCAPDQKPGDIIMPGMGKFNPQEMMERMQKMPKSQ